jgi:lipoprotein-releasing system ATP-binding protein
MSLQVEGLYKSYHQLSHEIPVLKGVSFSIASGRSLALVGASGIGKSTLLHCVGLIDTIDRGQIQIVGETIQQEEKIRCELRKKYIGFVFQFHYLMAELSAEENVAVPLLLCGASQMVAREKAAQWLDRVGLSHRRTHIPAELSGGEQQRVAIARALVNNPKIILADEPTGNLDPDTSRKVFEVLREQCKSLNSILIMATHNYELAKNLDETATLSGGVLA